MQKEISHKEQRIRSRTAIYYSKPEIQKAIFEFSKNREISPRYFEGFGKRPDSFQYPSEIYEFSKKGATSFHCSEELWEDPLQIETGMNEKQLNELRIGWDLLIDIDCPWFDYSKIAAKAVIQTLINHRIKNVGAKFSGSKGWHILVPWKAFPKEINGISTENLFPELPRKIMAYIRNQSGKLMREMIPPNFYNQFKGTKIRRGYKCKKCGEIVKAKREVEFRCENCDIVELKTFDEDNIPEKEICYKCKKEMVLSPLKKILKCDRCLQWREGFEEIIREDLFELMGLDLALVSSRHLFRMPYSLHEKTSLASVVINPEEIMDFEMKDADPLKVQIKNFMPNCEEGEASFLVREALDWIKTNQISLDKSYSAPSGKFAEFKPVKLENISDNDFPPSIKKILEGVSDGRKRAVFILIGLFRSIGMEKDEMEKRIFEWNKKNEIPLKEGYITAQLSWAYRRKPIPPPNFNTDFYKGIGAVPTSEEIRFKNPVTYTIRKNDLSNKKVNKFKNKK